MAEGPAPIEARDWRNTPFRLGAFHVDPRRNRITGTAGEVAIQPKVIDVLCTLAQQAGEVLSRPELIDRVWGKEFGADESLTRAISQLRRVFGDTRDVPRVIETIPKRGYRLIVPPVEAKHKAKPPAATERLRWGIAGGAAAILIAAILAVLWSRQRPAVHSERTGIVLTVEPFASGDGALPMAGFSDELSADIARSPLIRARSGTAPERSGDDLLQYRLSGNVDRIGDKLRVSARLDTATNGEAVWGETFERPFDAQFSARDSIISEITRDSFLPLLGAAKQNLSQRDPQKLLPWEATLIVTWVTGDESAAPGPPVEDSYWLQRHALAIDPNFAPAHALYAELAAYHALFHPPFDTSARHQEARRHAQRALELAPYDSEVLYQLSLYYRFAGDRERSEAMLKRVLELQPDHPLARIDLDFVDGQCGADPRPQIAGLTRQLRDLPQSSATRWVALAHLSAMRLVLGQFDEARAAAMESRKIVPMTWTAYALAAADAATGRNGEAAQVLAQHRSEWPNMDLRYFADRVVPRWCLGGPRTADAQRIFRNLADVAQPAQK